MKICSTIERLDDEYGGPAVSLPNLLNQLSYDYSVNNIVLSGHQKDCYIDNSTLDKNANNWITLETSGLQKLNYCRNLSKTLNTHCSDSDFIFSNNLWNYFPFQSYKFASKNKIPLVTSIRGALFPWSLEQGKTKKRIAWNVFQKAMLNSSALIHVTSEQERLAVKNLGIKAPVIICPHGIELPNIDQKNQKDHYKMSLGIEPDKRYFLFMSRLHKKKGLDQLLEVWERLSYKYKDWCLLIAGPDYGSYTSKISQMNTKQIITMGMLKGAEKEAAFGASEFFVLPSHTENFGVVIGESLARGIPVITTNNTPWSEINQIKAGACIELSNENLSRSIEVFLNMGTSELADMGLCGIDYIRKNYSWSAKAREFYLELKRVL